MSAIVEAARAHLGAPFKHRGRTAEGMDCAGLVVLAYAAQGVTLPDVPRYGREPHRNGLMDAVREAFGEPLRVSEPMQPGDVAVFRFQREPHHLGIFGDYPLGGLSLIHAHGQVGRVVEQRLDALWISRIVDVFRRPV